MFNDRLTEYKLICGTHLISYVLYKAINNSFALYKLLFSFAIK